MSQHTILITIDTYKKQAKFENLDPDGMPEELIAALEVIYELIGEMKSQGGLKPPEF